ncbi:hypothetical protein H2248_011226 [Termitomyces sp. 'cryptogamus']|nr:hypothetical protein H2248_011226 [Termitomyces sp. 'cryptogamus']
MATMRAVVYEKPFKVSVQRVQKPAIVHPDDVIVKGPDYDLHLRKVSSMNSHALQILKTTHLLYSDLHMYEGRVAAQTGIIFGHEKYASLSWYDFDFGISMGIVDAS